MKRTAVFPGSFDPITKGHVDLIKRALKLFDHIIVGVGSNSEKKYMFNAEQRLQMVQLALKGVDRIELVSYSGLTVELCRANGATTILRGIRNAGDFEFEKSIAFVNGQLAPEIETVFMVPDPNSSNISSTLVRDIIRNGGDASALLPEGVSL